MVSKRQLEEDIIDLYKDNSRINGRLNNQSTVHNIQSSQIEGLLELSKMQSMQIDALMEYLGVEIKVESIPSKEDIKVVKIKKGKK